MIVDVLHGTGMFWAKRRREGSWQQLLLNSAKFSPLSLDLRLDFAGGYASLRPTSKGKPKCNVSHHHHHHSDAMERAECYDCHTGGLLRRIVVSILSHLSCETVYTALQVVTRFPMRSFTQLLLSTDEI